MRLVHRGTTCTPEPVQQQETLWTELMMKEIPHGTVNGYDNYNCRCDACREANRIACAPRQKAYRKRNLARGLTAHGKLRTRRSPGQAPPHGTYLRYQWRKDPCRCDACREANTEYKYQYNQKRRKAG
ncbi:MAG: hypothetical protein ABWY25_09610 [Paenisporosarcina sp.]